MHFKLMSFSAPRAVVLPSQAASARACVSLILPLLLLLLPSLLLPLPRLFCCRWCRYAVFLQQHCALPACNSILAPAREPT